MANENKNRKTTKIKRERARKELIINIEIAAVKSNFQRLNVSAFYGGEGGRENGTNAIKLLFGLFYCLCVIM